MRYTLFPLWEHPGRPGLYLQYNLAGGCNHELFLKESLGSGVVGNTIWAEGQFVRAGSCNVLDHTAYALCRAGDPSD